VEMFSWLRCAPIRSSSCSRHRVIDVTDRQMAPK
jgi:hypothetical protein